MCDDCADWELKLTELPRGTTVRMRCHTCDRVVVASSGDDLAPVFLALAAFVLPILFVLLCLIVATRLE